MKRINIDRVKLGILFIILAAVVLAGCSQQAAAETTGAGYGGALTASYEGALNVTGQLALGTLALEGTAYAVTEEQAAALLPLWRILSGDDLQSDAERAAVVRQIEATMSEAQVSAITAMQLTQDDAQAWAQDQGVATAASGGVAQGERQMPEGVTEEQMAQMREQFQNMSDEEREEMRAQLKGGGSGTGQASPTTAELSRGLSDAVIDLLSARSGKAVAQAVPPVLSPTATPSPVQVSTTKNANNPADTTNTTNAIHTTDATTSTERTTVATAPTPAPTVESPSEPTAKSPTPAPAPESVVYVVQAGDSLAAIALAHGVLLETIVEANGIQDPNLIYVGQALILPGATGVATTTSTPPSAGESAVLAAQASTTTSTWISSALVRLPDNNPSPPFSIEVSANRATQDPLVQASQTYQVTGIVRNDGERTYTLSAIHVTFFDAEGFRGTFFKFPQPWETGGEWIWHGRTEADVASLLLAPGEEWPFSVEITAQDMASFLIHPDAVATERESAAVELSDVTLADEGTGYLRISGTATNSNPFLVKNVTVSGVLLDGDGQIVSLGSTYVLQEDIEPGEAVRFDVHIEKETYSDYQLYAQAERDGA